MPQRPGHVIEPPSNQTHAASHVSEAFDAVDGPKNDSSAVNGVALPANPPGAQTDNQSDEVPIHYVNNVAWRRHKTVAENEPLVDTTAALASHSKKTARLQRRQQKRQARKVHSDVQSFLDLPQELLSIILGFLQPSDIFNLLRLNQSMRAFILNNERSIAEEILNRRYWILRQCFPPPVSLDQVPLVARPALMSEQRQGRGRIHKIPYQHIKQIDPLNVCTCMSCVLSWNNLNVILDLAQWQENLESREPLPVIPPGRNPDWNVKLLDRHAAIVTQATKSPLTYARILQIHLDTTIRTIIRFGKWEKKGAKITKLEPRQYQLTDAEAAAGIDEFLDRKGPPSYQPLYMRDNYYTVGAFVPHRKWDRDEQKWLYYAKWPRPHDNDLNWIVARFAPKS
ncbi:uncharacterized protein A1O5_04471 [Cladophialophora psammophila CBS 110553]|uniref:F-box domain-containing protein n=1 Tax=Cladophialophora psammophila CBS 110553 TaxID=1182543 RepID=W9XNP9_9EURO|nr:uncharacterized protein A1O5_04471 [Cladophialophora psammophila CBS 110553]EXJ71969.1 hypothetical protein A1O5_04471 [Cladophialophora psammophila CBS 110553]